MPTFKGARQELRRGRRLMLEFLSTLDDRNRLFFKKTKKRKQTSLTLLRLMKDGDEPRRITAAIKPGRLFQIANDGWSGAHIKHRNYTSISSCWQPVNRRLVGGEACVCVLFFCFVLTGSETSILHPGLRRTCQKPPLNTALIL